MTDTAPVALAKREVEQENEEIVPALEEIKTFEIQSDSDQEFAAEILRDVKEKYRQVEEKRTSITGPLNQALRGVNDLFRPLKTALEDAERLLKGKIAGYQQRVDEQNRQALEEAAEAETPEEAQQVLATTRTVQSPQGVNVRHVWKPKVTDASKLPREYLMPNMSKLEAHAKAAKGQPAPIAGVTFTKVPIVASRRT